jgi:ribosomal protein S18 acetylase RimI-like enzyme
MEIYEEKNINVEALENLFTDCFNILKGKDSQNFNEDNDQEFREWFGIDYLKDYLKFSHVILAKEGKRIVGGAIVGMQNPLSYPDGKKYELFILGTLPSYRNKGIGRQLVEKVEYIAKISGAKRIILNTHELMRDTQKFYKDLGYIQIGILKEYYGNGGAAFLMKTL